MLVTVTGTPPRGASPTRPAHDPTSERLDAAAELIARSPTSATRIACARIADRRQTATPGAGLRRVGPTGNVSGDLRGRRIRAAASKPFPAPREAPPTLTTPETPKGWSNVGVAPTASSDRLAGYRVSPARPQRDPGRHGDRRGRPHSENAGRSGAARPPEGRAAPRLRLCSGRWSAGGVVVVCRRRLLDRPSRVEVSPRAKHRFSALCAVFAVTFVTGGSGLRPRGQSTGP